MINKTVGRQPNGSCASRRLTVSRGPVTTAPVTPVVRVEDSAGEHRTVGLEELTGDLQAKGVQAGEGGQVRGREGSVEHVEVFQMDSVRTSIIGRPRPSTRQRRATACYTLDCEEPVKCAD